MKMYDGGRNELGHKIIMHFKDSMQVTKEFKQVVINGTKYCTKNYANGKKTENCGISVCTQDGTAWYDQLTSII